MRLLQQVLSARDNCAWDETLWADCTLLDTGLSRVSFLTFFRSLVEGVSKPPLENIQKQGEREEYEVMVMRACFLLALVYDQRAKRFFLTPHAYHPTGSFPASSFKTLAFCHALLPATDDALACKISLAHLVEYSCSLWINEYMFSPL
jgi:hypothetical protein